LIVLVSVLIGGWILVAAIYTIPHNNIR